MRNNHDSSRPWRECQINRRRHQILPICMCTPCQRWGVFLLCWCCSTIATHFFAGWFNCSIQPHPAHIHSEIHRSIYKNRARSVSKSTSFFVSVHLIIQRAAMKKAWDELRYSVKQQLISILFSFSFSLDSTSCQWQC